MATKIGAYGFVEVSSLKQYNLNVLFDTALLAVIERSIHHLAYTILLYGSRCFFSDYRWKSRGSKE